MDSFSRSVRLRVELAKQSLRSLAADPALAAADSEQCSAVVTNYLSKSATVFNTLARTNADRMFDCSNVSSMVGTSGRGEQYRYLDTIFNSPEHSLVVSDVVVGSVNGVPTPYIAIHVPVYRDGVFSGTLGTSLYLRNIGVEALELSHLFSRSNTIIVDNAQNIVYESIMSDQVVRYDKSRTLSTEAKDAVARSLRSTQTESVVQYTDGRYLLMEKVQFASNYSWYIFTEISEQDVIGAMDSSRFGVLLMRATPLEHGILSFIVVYVLAAVVHVIVRGVRRI